MSAFEIAAALALGFGRGFCTRRQRLAHQVGDFLAAAVVREIELAVVLGASVCSNSRAISETGILCRLLIHAN